MLVAATLAWRSGAAWFGATERMMSVIALLGTAAGVAAIVRRRLIATLVSAPMLLVYAITQPIVPGTVAVAWALVAVQLAAILLCVGRKLIGALLLSLADVALLVLALACIVASVRLATIDANVVAYYAMFWMPAGVASLIAGVVMLRPLRALLRHNS